MEYLLIALGGCTGIDVVSLLKKWKVPPKSLRIEITAERREEFPRTFSKIKLKYIASGVKEEDLKKAIEESMKKYCSVSAMLGSVAEIEYEYQLE
jgi:putative redox protein